MTGAKVRNPPPTASGLHPKVTSHETSVEQTERFLEAQSSEGFVPVEYKVELLHDLSSGSTGHNRCHNLEEALNELGAEGWELAALNRMDGYAIFKRC